MWRWNRWDCRDNEYPCSFRAFHLSKLIGGRYKILGFVRIQTKLGMMKLQDGMSKFEPEEVIQMMQIYNKNKLRVMCASFYRNHMTAVVRLNSLYTFC